MRWIYLLCLLCLLGGCVRSSDPRLYTLVSAQGSATYPLLATIEVHRPTIAGYLDRREVIRSISHEQLDLDDHANWAEALDSMLGRVLATDLALRLPQSRVITDSNTLGAVPDRVIDLELQRFEQDDSGLVLRALVAIRVVGQAAPVTLELVELRAERQRGTADVVASMNRLLSSLADQIASKVAVTP